VAGLSSHTHHPAGDLYLRNQLAYRGLVSQLANYLPTFSRSATAYEGFERAPVKDAIPKHVLKSDLAAFYQDVHYDLIARALVAQTGDGQREVVGDDGVSSRARPSESSGPE